MRICPECGWPHSDVPVLIEGESDEECSFCSWKGPSKDLLLIAGGDLENHPQLMDRLRVLMEYVAQYVGPQMVVKMIKLGLLPADMQYKELIATVSRDISRGAFKSAVVGLFPMKEQEDADETEPG